jgi:hypothetical protein
VEANDLQEVETCQKRIERLREIYEAIAADAAACGLTPKQFAERFMERVSGNCESSGGI